MMMFLRFAGQGSHPVTAGSKGARQGVATSCATERHVPRLKTCAGWMYTGSPQTLRYGPANTRARFEGFVACDGKIIEIMTGKLPATEAERRLADQARHLARAQSVSGRLIVNTVPSYRPPFGSHIEEGCYVPLEASNFPSIAI